LQEVMAQGAQRHSQWQTPAFAISNETFREMKEASRQSRLTPEYAQHFFVDALTELGETPAALPEETQTREPGDAAVVGLSLARSSTARALGLPVRRNRLFTFRTAVLEEQKEATYLALGTPIVDRLLATVQERWAGALHKGAKFIDLKLAPGDAYLLWFLAAQVRDGRDQSVTEHLFALRQTPDGMSSVPASQLIDLVPTDELFVVPDSLRTLSRLPQTAVDWSTDQLQLPFLAQARRGRDVVTALRREPLLADAISAERAAQEAYDDLVFSGEDSADADQQRERARLRVQALGRQFDQEAACSLGPTRVIGVAAVFSLVGEPEEELIDERPHIADAAMAHARQYEQRKGRATRDVTGNHTDYPYDLHSTGPGGVRCIEVKGTTTGRVILSETEWRAAQRLRHSYYLYIIRDPLDEQPTLTIVRDPWDKMTHDDLLYSGARYVYNARTWQSAADESTPL
jgi:hypothetical protein